MIDNLTVYELFHNTNFFGVCETAADVVAKEVQISDFQLDVGVSVMIKFKYSNSATSPTLNISSSGAIPICLTNPSETSVSWEEWDVIPFTYDGTYWQMTSNPGVKVTQIPTDTTNSNFEILFSGSADNDGHIEEARKSSAFIVNPYEKTFSIKDNNNDQLELWLEPGHIGIFNDNNSDDILLIGTNDSEQPGHLTNVLRLFSTDIYLNDTWDGTNISLKDSISALGDVFVSPTTSVAGKKGMVPAPAVIEHVDNKLFLRSDGTWDFEGVYRETQYTDGGAPQNFYHDGNGDIVIVNNWTPQRKIDEASDGKNGIYYNTYFNDNYQIQRGIPQDEYEISLGSRGIYLEINTFDDYTKKKNNIPVSENISSMDISAGDIVVSTTWDGTNDSLKDAIGSAKGTVLQTETTSGNYEFEVLFSDTTDLSTTTGGARKSSHIVVNPYYNSLTVKQDNYTAVQMRPNNNRSQVSVYGGTSSTHYSISIEADTSGADITNSATWDGTHASLKSTIAAILARLN